MACRLFSDKPLFEPMQANIQQAVVLTNAMLSWIESLETHFIQIWIKTQQFS